MKTLTMKPSLRRTIALVAIFTAGMTAVASAQPAQSTQPGMMPDQMGKQMMDMMGQGMMGQGMMGGRPASMPMMHGQMAMKIIFAIIDADGDGGVSFEEMTAIHRRIFAQIDANKDDKVTPEELQSFMRE